MTLDRTSVAVSGLATAAVRIRVTGGYDSDEPSLADMPLNVWLKRTSGSGPRTLLVSTDLPRVSGTTQNGVWEGSVYVPSTANGVFTVFGVTPGPLAAYESGAMPPDPTPVTGPALTVNGSHLPKITAKVTPSIVPFGSGFTITWTVIDMSTGKPYTPRIRVLLGIGNQCDDNQGGDTPLTSTSGTVTKTYPASAGNALVCLRLHGGSIWDIASLTFFVARPGIVSAVPSKTSAPVGTLVPVTGNVLGAPSNCTVLLQRLYGGSQWRAVNSGTVRTSGRFTLTAQPAYKGVIPYRVYFPACGRYQTGISKVFSIRGL